LEEQMTERLFLGILTPSEILALLTAVLVGVTAFYAWQTKGLVDEMREARATSVLPRLAVSIQTLIAGVGWVRLANIGPGPALDVTATLTMLPDGFDISWTAHVVAPNEHRDFIPTPPDDPHAQLGYLNRLTERFSHIRLVAEYKDALGTTHHTDETIEIREWWRGVVEAHSLVVKDWDEETAKELGKINDTLKSLARDASAIRQRGDNDPWIWESRLSRVPERYRPAARKALQRLGLLD
jgi:hypothetical protein